MVDQVPLVMLPGLGFSKCVWEPLQALCADNFSILPVDYDFPPPNVLQSPPPNVPRLVRGIHLDDWFACIADTLPTQAHYVGWSLGGLLAWKLAQQQPERVLSIATVASTPRFLATDNWPGVAEKAWRPFEERSQAVMQKRLLRLCSLPSQDGNGLLCRSEAASRNDRDGWYLGLQALKTWDMRDWLASTATPVRILLAEDDALLPSAALQAKIPGSQLVPGGHTSIYTHPQACYAKLKEFWHEL